MAGLGDSDQTIFEAKDDSVVPVVGLDYGFLAPRREADQACTPMTYGKDRSHKRVLSWRCRSNVSIIAKGPVSIVVV